MAHREETVHFEVAATAKQNQIEFELNVWVHRSVYIHTYYIIRKTAIDGGITIGHAIQKYVLMMDA